MSDDYEEGEEIDTSGQAEVETPEVKPVQAETKHIDTNHVLNAAQELLERLRDRRTMKERTQYDALQSKGKELLMQRVNAHRSEALAKKEVETEAEKVKKEEPKEEEKTTPAPEVQTEEKQTAPTSSENLGKRKREESGDQQQEQMIPPPTKRQNVNGYQQNEMRQNNTISRGFANRFSIGDAMQKRAGGSRFG